MPGFGRMIGAPKRLENRINVRIIRFFEFNAQNIVLAVHVLDVSTFLEVTWRLEKKGFFSVDVEMVQFLAKTLGEFPFQVSAKTRDGLGAFKSAIHERLVAEGYRTPFKTH